MSEIVPQGQPEAPGGPHDDIPAVETAEPEPDSMAEEADKAHDKAIVRERLLAGIVQNYTKHPEVRRRIKLHRVEPPSPEIPNVLNRTEVAQQRLDWLTKQFPLIEERGVTQGYFRDIEAGIVAARSDDAPTAEREAVFVAAAAAQHILLLTNLRLAIGIGSKLAPGAGTMGWSDVVHEGILGLNRAIAGFDHTKGFEFSSYATRVITGYIQSAIANQSRLHRIPADIHNAWQGIKRDWSELIKALGREPTEDELLQELVKRAGPTRDIDSVRTYFKLTSFDAPSLDQPVSSEAGSASLGEAGWRDESQELYVEERAIIKAAITGVLRSDALTYYQKLVLALCYGIPEVPWTAKDKKSRKARPEHDSQIAAAAQLGGIALTEIAKVLGIEYSAIHAAHAGALRSARKLLERPAAGPSADKTPYYRRRKKKIR